MRTSPFPRNRVRHELHPAARITIFTGVTAVLAREAALAQQDEDFLHEKAIELAGRIVLTDERAVRLDAAVLAQAPRALSSRVVREVLEQHAGSKSVSFDHIEQVLGLEPGQAVSLPGQEGGADGGDVIRLERAARKRRRQDLLSCMTRRSRKDGGNSFAVSLSIPERSS